MKTDVIHLEPFDDIDSIRERLEWAAAGRVLLVWPKRGEVCFTRLDMVFLARKAIQLNKQLAIVNEREDFTELAVSAGIPVFFSQVSATLARWPKLQADEIDREQIARENYRSMLELSEKVENLREEPPQRAFLRTASVTAAALAVAAMVLFFLPGATIEVFPAVIDQSLRLTIHADPGILKADMAGNVPLHSVVSLQKASDQAETSGQLLIPSQYAHGQISLENLTGKAVTVATGSIVTTLTDPPVRFTTLENVALEADGKAVVDVQAVEPGSGGNIFEEEIQSLEGPLGLDVRVTNEAAFSGGNESSQRSVSEDDIATLREKVKSMLLAQAGKDFSETGKNDAGAFQFLDDTLKIEKIIDEEISTPAGKPADTVTIALTGEARMTYIDTNEVKAAFAAAMDAGMPSGFEVKGDDLMLKPVGAPQFDPGTGAASWEVEGLRRLRSNYSPRTIIQAVTGQTSRQALQTLSGLLKHRAVPQIHLTPFWWPRLPYLPFRIEVVEGQ